MNRQLALKLVSKMQTNVWDLTDKQAKIILSFLECDNKRSEQLKCECKIPEFNRTVDSDFNYVCGKCNKTL